MKKKISFILLMLCCLATVSFAQNSHPDNDKTFMVFQGDGVYEDGMMTMLKGLRNYVWNGWSMFISDAKALSAIFMIIFFAIRSYEMMVGDKQLEIMPLLRSFGLEMVILWWGVFVKVIAFPTEVIEQQAQVRWQSA